MKRFAKLTSNISGSYIYVLRSEISAIRERRTLDAKDVIGSDIFLKGSSDATFFVTETPSTILSQLDE